VHDIVLSRQCKNLYNDVKSGAKKYDVLLVLIFLTRMVFYEVDSNAIEGPFSSLDIIDGHC